MTLPPAPIPPSATGRSALDSGAASLLLALAGSALVGSRNRVPRATRTVATLAGLTLLGLAAYPPVSAAVRRAGTRRRQIRVHGSFVIEQPVERVFAVCRDFEHFPRFFGALRQVRDFGDGRSHWSASTPAGHVIEWNAVTTKYVPNRVIAWESAGTRDVRAGGLLRFRPEEGRTCLEVTLTFEVLGEAALDDSVAALVAPRRVRQVETDLRRFAFYLNTAPDVEFGAYERP